MDYTQRFFELNPFHKRMTETDYFDWLKAKNKNDINATEAKTEYLNERFNFKRGTDYIGQKAIKAMRYIENYYFHFYVQKSGEYHTTRDVGMS
jgi:hypothetical protein